jgi:polyisoprenoid-binding protein YceI
MSPRFIVAVIAFLGTASLVASAAAPAPLQVDRAHSIATFAIKHLVVTNVQGTMNIVSVDMPLQSNSVIPTSVDAVIDVGTVNTAEATRDKDLRSADWFDVARFPTMRFVSARIEPESAPNTFRAIGTLSLHGISKTVALDVTYSGDARDEHGIRHYGYSATTTLDRRDFGLDALKTTPGGALLVGTNVKVSIDLDMVAAG